MTNFFSFFRLYTGVTLAFFHVFGKMPFWRQLVYIIKRGWEIESSASRSIFAEMSSKPWDLFGSTFLIKLVIWLWVILILFNVFEVFLTKGGNRLVVSSIVHWFWKYELKMLHLCFISVMKMPLSRMGVWGICYCCLVDVLDMSSTFCDLFWGQRLRNLVFLSSSLFPCWLGRGIRHVVCQCLPFLLF